MPVELPVFRFLKSIFGENASRRPKVRIAELVKVERSSDWKARGRTFRRASQKHIDFVVIEKAANIRLAVEIDDSHSLRCKLRDALN